MKNKFTFVGKRLPDGTPAEFIPGIPARDIQDVEFSSMPKETQEIIKSSKLYKSSDVEELAKTPVEKPESSEVKNGR